MGEGGIDAQLLFEMMRRQSRLGPSASARDLVRAIEETIGDGLIEARQGGAKRVRLAMRDGSIAVEPAG